MYSPCVKHFWCAIYIKKRSLYVNVFYFLNVFDVQINIYTHMRVLQAFQSEIAFYKCHTLPGIYWSVGTRSGKFLSFDAPIGARGFDGRGLCYSYCPESLLIDAHRWLLLEKFFFFPPPSFSSVVRWFHTKVILHIPLILSNLWEILGKTTTRQNLTKLLNWALLLSGLYIYKKTRWLQE